MNFTFIKYVSFHIVTFVLIIFCYSCSQKQNQIIGFFLPNKTDARYLKDMQYFTEKANELGYKAITQFADNDANLQEKQVKDLIDKGVKVVVISSVNQNLAASIVRYAHENGVRVIAYERIIDNCPLDFMVGFDHKIVGELQARYLIEKCPRGNYIIIGGDKQDRNAELIYEGQMKVLNPHIASNSIKIIYQTFVEDWAPDNAYHIIKRIKDLSGERIDAVLSANDGMAGEIIHALDENQNNGSYWITGLDADLEGCKRIVQGKQSMTIYKPFQKLADISAELAVQILKRENNLKARDTIFNGKFYVPIFLLQPECVDKENINSTVIKDGFQKREDVFQ